ncbi:MAG: pyridoxamine 5'-phosphate oxidase family protein [Mangrovibacterium sp.]
MRTILVTDLNEIKELLASCRTCFVALIDGDLPYVVPMNFGFDGEYIILHSGMEGRKWHALKNNQKVCISWMIGDEIVQQNEQVACSYRVKSKTIMLEGVVEFVEDYADKLACLHAFMGQYSEREFKFNRPAVENVGLMKVKVDGIVAKCFGVPAK